MPMGAPEERTHVGPLSRPEWRRGRARTGVAGVGLADDIGGEGADGGDGLVVEALDCEARHGCEDRRESGRSREGGKREQRYIFLCYPDPI